MPEHQRLAIETIALTKTLRAVIALDGLNLTVGEGEVHGFLGPNGAGKSTAIRVLLGLAKPDSGTARLLGADPWTDAVSLHREIAYVPGDVTLMAVAHRRRDHRPAGTDARWHRPAAPSRVDRAFPAGPAEEMPHLLQGQPAEGFADLGVLLAGEAAAVGRAQFRTGPVDGERVSAMCAGSSPIGASRCCCRVTSSPKPRTSASG